MIIYIPFYSMPPPMLQTQHLASKGEPGHTQMLRIVLGCVFGSGLFFGHHLHCTCNSLELGSVILQLLATFWHGQIAFSMVFATCWHCYFAWCMVFATFGPVCLPLCMVFATFSHFNLSFVWYRYWLHFVTSSVQS